MEIIQEGRNFRLIQESELSDVLVILGRYLPESLKVKLHLSSIPVILFLSSFFFCLFALLSWKLPRKTNIIEILFFKLVSANH